MASLDSQLLCEVWNVGWNEYDKSILAINLNNLAISFLKITFHNSDLVSFTNFCCTALQQEGFLDELFSSESFITTRRISSSRGWFRDNTTGAPAAINNLCKSLDLFDTGSNSWVDIKLPDIEEFV